MGSEITPSTSLHYTDVIMGTIPSQITSLAIIYSTVYSDADQRKHQSSASLAFVRVIHRWPVNSPHIWPVTRKMFPFDDVIMTTIPRVQCVNGSYYQMSYLPYHIYVNMEFVDGLASLVTGIAGVRKSETNLYIPRDQRPSDRRRLDINATFESNRYLIDVDPMIFAIRLPLVNQA